MSTPVNVQATKFPFVGRQSSFSYWHFGKKLSDRIVSIARHIVTNRWRDLFLCENPEDSVYQRHGLRNKQQATVHTTMECVYSIHHMI